MENKYDKFDYEIKKADLGFNITTGLLLFVYVVMLINAGSMALTYILYTLAFGVMSFTTFTICEYVCVRWEWHKRQKAMKQEEKEKVE